MTYRASSFALVASLLAACAAAPAALPLGPAGEGKSDAALSGLGLTIDHFGVAASMRSQVHRGVTQARDGHVTTERVVVTPAPDQDLVTVLVETEDVGWWMSDDERTALVFSIRTAEGEPWRPVMVDHGAGLEVALIESITYQRSSQSIAFTAVGRDGEVAHVEASVELTEGASFSAQVVPTVAALEATDATLAYRLVASCHGETCGEPAAPIFASEIPLSSPTQFPKCIDYDPVDRAIYATSLSEGTIVRVYADGREEQFFGGMDGLSSVGVAVDPETRLLWSCLVDSEDDALPGRIVVFDMDGEGAPLYEIDLSDAFENANCNEMSLLDSETALVTDRMNPNVYRVDLRTQSAEILATDPLFDRELVGLNGVVATPDGERVLTVNYNHPRMMVFPVDDPSDVRRVELIGGGLRDGLIGGPTTPRFIDNTMYLILPSHIVRITPLDPEWNRARIQRVDLDQGVTADDWWTGLAVVEGDLYISNGRTSDYLLGRTPEPFRLVRLDWDIFDTP